MATFKNAIVAGVGTSASNVYITPAANTSIIIGLDVTNTTASDITATVTIRDVSANLTANVIRNALVPVGTNLNIIAGQKLVLEAGDYVQVTSSAAASLDAIGAILEGV